MSRHFGVLLLLALQLQALLCLRGQGPEPSCRPQVHIRRKTVLKAAPRQSLQIVCPVTHCGGTPQASWCKLLGDSCREVNETEDVKISSEAKQSENEFFSYLEFKKISVEDDGLYRCSVLSAVSHSINVSVSDSYVGINGTDSSDNKTNGASSRLLYVYVCVGVILLVAMVTAISSLSLRGRPGCIRVREPCGEEKQETSSALPPPSPVPAGGSSSAAALSHRQPAHLHGDAPPATLLLHPVVSGAPSAPETRARGQGSDDVVYAALDHLSSSEASPRPPRPASRKDETSEYAAIRVSGREHAA